MSTHDPVRTATGIAPAWFTRLLRIEALPGEGDACVIDGTRYRMVGNILRAEQDASPSQAQTSDAFGFKWARRDTYDSPASFRAAREWLLSRYGDPDTWPWLANASRPPVLVDAGCGAGVSGIALFEPVLDRIHYLGVDVSSAVDVARARWGERGHDVVLLQADLMRLPIAPGSVDILFSEGVLHHTDSTREAIAALAPLLRPGGRFLFYVYRRKGPIREFTDDYIREQLAPMSDEEAWAALEPLTRLGEALGQLDVTVDVPEAIELLDIPAGPVNVQRLFYWHVFKAFYRPDFSFEEMNHVNFDWYRPDNAHRQSPDEVRHWCESIGLEVEHMAVEAAGITVTARRPEA